MYLNTVESGGETIFPTAGLTIRPRQGDALLFYNVYANGELDPESLHGSSPVLAGEKWVATKWVREAEYTRPRRTP
jgi:prolyl 4-hydroxylase